MLKQFIDHLHCSLAGHVRGMWTAVPGKCAEASSCRRCGNVAVRVSHTWLAWAPADTGCEHVKACAICGDSQRMRLHQWVSDGLMTHRCTTCGVSAWHEGLEGGPCHLCGVCRGDCVSGSNTPVA